MKIAFIPGDGVGPEVAWAARRCLEATGVAVEWVRVDAGLGTFGRLGDALPAAAVKAVLAVDAVLRGPLDGCGGGRGRNPAAALDEALGVFATVRRCRAVQGRSLPSDGMDLLVIAQQEGSGGGGEGSPREFFEFALSRAAAAGRRRVALAHRGPADAAWIRAGLTAARRRPELEVEDQLVGHAAMQLARSPHRFDVLVAGPVHGEVLGDLGVGLAGGLGWVPAARHGVRGAVFTTVHGTAPRLAGTGRINPSAMILAGADLLAWRGEGKAAARLEEALRGALEGDPDPLAGPLADRVAARLAGGSLPAPRRHPGA